MLGNTSLTQNTSLHLKDLNLVLGINLALLDRWSTTSQ
jgi:hypothetical protein